MIQRCTFENNKCFDKIILKCFFCFNCIKCFWCLPRWTASSVSHSFG